MKKNLTLIFFFLLFSLLKCTFIDLEIINETVPLTSYMDSRIQNGLINQSNVELELKKSAIDGLDLIDSLLKINFIRGDIEYFNATHSTIYDSSFQNFSKRFSNYQRVSLRRNTFNGGQFSKSKFYITNFDENHINNVQISQCSFEVVSFRNTTLINVSFKNCTFQYTTFINCKFQNVTFHDCKFYFATSLFSQKGIYNNSYLNGQKIGPGLFKRNTFIHKNEEIHEIFFNDELMEPYDKFLDLYNKPIPKDRRKRQSIFYQNVKMVIQFNKKQQKWKMGMNQFSDLTSAQFQQLVLMDQQIIQNTSRPIFQVSNQEHQDSFDWRKTGIITPVKNQGLCGSCWAFAVTAAHQSYQIRFKNAHKKIDLSEQQIVQCAFSQPYYSIGCQGGYFQQALDLIIQNGQTSQVKYPYIGKSCFKSTCCSCCEEEECCRAYSGEYKIKGYTSYSGCSKLEEFIRKNPVIAFVNSSDWKNYKSGIFEKGQDSKCEKEGQNHVVLIVGYTKDYWLIKNSWSKNWGERGYMRLKKGNTCSICRHYTYIKHPSEE